MRKLTVTLCLTVAVLLGSEVRGSDLPVCKRSPSTKEWYPPEYWHNCYGEWRFGHEWYKGEWKSGKEHGHGTYDFGPTVYTGKWRNGKRHGRGKLVFKYGNLNGQVWDGLWQNDTFLGPSVIARKSSPHSKSASEKGIESLPECEGSPTRLSETLKFWKNCKGIFIPKNDSRNLRYTYVDGDIKRFGWASHGDLRRAKRNDRRFRNNQKTSPTVIAKKSPPPSKSPAERENERMSNLKSLTMTELPNKSVDPAVRRREKLIEKLNEQLKLVRNPNFKVRFNRWETNDAGKRIVVEKTKPIKPWWFTDSQGDVFLTVRVGHKKIEFEKGKTAIRIGTKDKLESFLNTVIAATQSSELDAMIP